MGLREFYQGIGADFEIVLNRLMNEKLIYKYLKLFIQDNTFETLKEAFSKQDGELAFRSAHTLKGLCLNLELTSLLPMIQQLTDTLRSHQISDQATKEFQEFSCLYDDLIKQLTCILEGELNE